MARPILIANWKMNVPAIGAKHFVRDAAGVVNAAVEMVVAPPFPFLSEAVTAAESHGGKIAIAAQNCHDKASGAFTGEVSTSMLQQLGVSMVIIGHSERRQFFGDTDEWIGRKLAAARAAGLMPVFCVGEDEATYERGATMELIERQLREAFRVAGSDLSPLVIAYEPVWAIGTGKNATPEIAARTHRGIRSIVKEIAPSAEYRVIYGGSVTPANARELASSEEIEGFLVGGASLEVTKFLAIYEALQDAAVAI
jgi:triosephosphate isomerase